MNAYHGTNNDFSFFDTDMLGSATGGDGTSLGFFFATDYDHASYWANRATDEQGGQAKIMEVKLNICNSEIVDMEELNNSDRPVYLNDIIESAVDNGFDSIIINNMRDDESGELKTSIVVFDADLIEII